MNIKQGPGGVMSFVGPEGDTVMSMHPGNNSKSSIVGQIRRTDTTAKVLGYIPAGAIPISLMWVGVANSDAATTATMSVGYTTGTEFLNGVNVKASSTTQTSPAAGAALGAVLSATADTAITGVYAETGTASTTGGPWTVVIDYFMP